MDSVCVTDPELWNDLPDEIRKSNSIDCFKRRIKTYFLSFGLRIITFNFLLCAIN